MGLGNSQSKRSEKETVTNNDVSEDGPSTFPEPCRKHPGHRQYIPVDQFVIDDLPPEWRDAHTFAAIKAASKRVVKVITSYTSPERPESDGFSSLSSKRCIRVGTGFAFEDFALGEKDSDTPQICYDLSKHQVHLSGRSEPRFNFFVQTAAHVVFDEQEAKATKVIFFDDCSNPGGHVEGSCKQNSKYARASKLEKTVKREEIGKKNGHSGPEIFRGRGRSSCVLSPLEADVIGIIQPVTGFESRESDICFLECVSPNLDLKKALLALPTAHFPNKCPPTIQRPREPLVVIISHPHGMSKRISLGTEVSVGENPKYENADMLEHGKNSMPYMKGEVGGFGAFSEEKQQMHDDFRTDEYFIPEKNRSALKKYCDANPKIIPGELLRDSARSTAATLMSRVSYNTPTCPGSSGAPIFVLRDRVDGWVDYRTPRCHVDTRK